MGTILVERQRGVPALEAKSLGVGLLALAARWLSRVRSRRQLRLLLADPRVLADLGLTADQADQESLKPFWR
ncbi:MAG TPA: hypothetical protein VGV37_19080 [Aliidongia sp.]|uniref:hypothetical protein n=1 Tax=Aliidongia sp. TaxID=1914230 RepID=UPI002DDCDC98|nr:hypothetical protein [Aliidongia sp.]HEV2676637.1 hypothetical protein [Aliidongia sp.]